jgi:predicted unusual protein kinase regulating ubiquinone biosynthesis (AarF/ABC1/UbiB family)
LIKRLRLKSLYWLIEPTREFAAWSDEELDYRREARYMEQHRQYVQHNPNERVPQVRKDLVSRRILVAEFMDGVNVLDYLRSLERNDESVLENLRAKGFEGSQFVYRILENFLTDAYQFGMFHADLHPANLIILPGNSVGYIDFGITGVLSRYSRQCVIALTLALGRGDLEGMCRAFFKISTLNRESDVEGFREGIKKLAGDWYELRGKKQKLVLNATLVMLDMLKLSHRTGIYPERDVVKYIRSAIAIDGLITRVAPEFDLGRNLELICNRHLRWQLRRAVFTYDTVLSWASAGSHLLQDGPYRVTQALNKMAHQQPTNSSDRDVQAAKGASILRRGSQLTTLVFVVAAFTVITGEATQSGVNIFVAEIIFVITATLLLLRTMFRGSETG